MDIYKFFNVFHNPRLHSTPPRQQELSELELVSSEIRKALERLQVRSKRKTIGPILPDHFSDMLKAAKFIEASLGTLCDAHPGDSKATIEDLVSERQTMKGWESWTSLLSEQLKTLEQENSNQISLKKAS
jgi:hypothetical protein